MGNTTTKTMSKTKARKIARHLHGGVFITVASLQSGRTWGFSAAAGHMRKTTIDVGDYRQAQRCRKENVERMVEDLMDGTAPEWASLDFVW